MFLLYMDEAGTHDSEYFTLCGVAVFERKTYWISSALDQIQKKFLPEIVEPVELHASSIRAGREAPWNNVDRKTRYQIIDEVYDVIRQDQVVLFASAVEKSWLDKDKDIYIFSNLTGVGNMEVNAFQTACDVTIQKSLKEGFGLVVSEALWKATPVVAGNTGGIPLQMTGELSRCLVSNEEECAQKVIYLLQHPEFASELGEFGREHIRQNFLMPRLIRDELNLVKELLRS